MTYRYRIQDNEMHPDLKWLAENVSEWNPSRPYTDDNGKSYIRKCDAALLSWTHCSPGSYSGVRIKSGNLIGFTYDQWLQARKDLGLIMTESEEELPAQEWSATITDTSEEAAMVEDMVNGKSDMVNAPPHYQLRPGYEVYDLRQDLAAKAANGGATYAQYSDWDRATEYLLRMWGKNKLEDLKKCRWYVDKLIEKLESE